MAEIQHPAIDFELQNIEPVPLAMEFAETAYEVLANYKYLESQVRGETQVTRPITGRVDIISKDPSTMTAFRLKRLLASAFTPNVELVSAGGTEPGAALQTPDDNSSEYIVIALEHGTIPPEDVEDMDEEIEDCDFIWQPYAVAVTHANSDEAYVLNGETGTIFSDGDIVQALYALNLLQKHLRTTEFERTLFEDDSVISIQVEKAVADTTFKPFDHEEVIESNYDHHYCIPGCTVPSERHQRSYEN